jgi:plasmid replication initiation protein
MDEGRNTKLAVRVNNEMQKIPLLSLTQKGMDLFMGICAKMKNTHGSTLEFSFGELRELCAIGHWKTGGYKGFTDNDMYSLMSGVAQEIAKLFTTYTEKYMMDGKEYRRTSVFTLFETFRIDEGTKSLTVSVSPMFSFMLNDITGEGFTQFRYSQYLSLSSKYTKEIFRHLMQRKNGNPQWQGAGKGKATWAITVEDFAELL